MTDVADHVEDWLMPDSNWDGADPTVASIGSSSSNSAQVATRHSAQRRRREKS